MGTALVLVAWLRCEGRCHRSVFIWLRYNKIVLSIQEEATSVMRGKHYEGWYWRFDSCTVACVSCHHFLCDEWLGSHLYLSHNILHRNVGSFACSRELVIHFCLLRFHFTFPYVLTNLSSRCAFSRVLCELWIDTVRCGSRARHSLECRTLAIVNPFACYWIG